MLTPIEKAAFITAQTQMMIAQRDVMLEENKERELAGLSQANGAREFERLLEQWEPILGYNALIAFFRD